MLNTGLLFLFPSNLIDFLPSFLNLELCSLIWDEQSENKTIKECLGITNIHLRRPVLGFVFLFFSVFVNLSIDCFKTDIYWALTTYQVLKCVPDSPYPWPEDSCSLWERHRCSEEPVKLPRKSGRQSSRMTDGGTWELSALQVEPRSRPGADILYS